VVLRLPDARDGSPYRSRSTNYRRNIDLGGKKGGVTTRRPREVGELDFLGFNRTELPFSHYFSDSSLFCLRANYRPKPDWKAKVYPDAARWIAQNTNPAATLATIDIGHLGYWSNRRIIDIVGLAQPDVAPHIAQGDFSYAIRQYQPDLVLIGYTWLPEVQALPWFQADYAPRHYFKYSFMDIPLVLFSRRAGVKVQPEPLPAAAEVHPVTVDFNRQVQLTGYHLDQPLQPGGSLDLTLFWQAKTPITIDFTVFVQLVGAANTTIVAQADGKPQDGFYPTNYWQPGETIIDRHTVPLPGDLPPGNYDLLLGFYEAGSGQRLQILDEAGVFKSDHLRLTGIPVQAP
jgi:hypothetical protein